MRKNLICKKPMRYAGKPLAVGDPFDATESEARLLMAVNLADEAPEVQPAVAASDEAKLDKPTDTPRKGTYQRRDLKAEG